MAPLCRVYRSQARFLLLPCGAWPSGSACVPRDVLKGNAMMRNQERFALSRRRLIAGLGAGVGAAVLAACQAPPAATQPTPAPAGAQAPTPAAGAPGTQSAGAEPPAAEAPKAGAEAPN